jgi:transketolase
MHQTTSQLLQFQDLARDTRLRLVRMHYESKVGHLGGNLSCLDALLYLHHCVMNEDDIFVLAKGHAAGALYATLWSRNRLSDDELRRFHADGGKLAGHPVAGWMPEIGVATGSLGHGFPVSAGIALGKRLQGQKGRVYCLMSDGEWQEGSNWEALIFAHHHKLDNLTVLVDVNRLQGFGTTAEVASMGDLRRRIAAFDVFTTEIDGHKPEALATIGDVQSDGPQFIMLNTVKGKGISFMENRMEWHYLPLNEQQYQQALTELGNA